MPFFALLFWLVRALHWQRQQAYVFDFTQRDPEAESNFAEAYQPRSFAMFREGLRGFA